MKRYLSKERLKYLYTIPQEKHPERLYVLNHIKDTDSVVYDLGCGRHKTLSRAIGIDIKRCTDIVASIDWLPMIKDESADIIISRHSLEHLLNPIQALGEWERILKSTGKLIIVLPDHEFLDTMDHQISNGKHLHAYTRYSFVDLISILQIWNVVEVETVMEGLSFGVVAEKVF